MPAKRPAVRSARPFALVTHPSSDNTLRVRRRHRPEVRQALILEAAREIIAEKGLGAATAREIAARCDISTGTLTHHFPSMEQLLVEALRSASKEFTDENVAAAAAVEGARARLDILIETALPDKPDALRNWRLWLEYWARAVHDPDLADVHRERYREWRGAFERVIREGVDRGEFLPADPVSTARELVGLVDGLCIEAAIGDEAVPIDEARRIIFEWVDRRLGRET
jgi:AcrR family transcriptional regulator